MQISTLKLIFTFLILVNVVIAQSSLTISPKISLDLDGKHTVSMQGQEGSLNVNKSFSFALDIIHNIIDSTVGIGGGIMYLLPREQELEGSGEFNFMPIYVVCKIKLGNTKNNFYPSLIANLGFNIVYGGDQAYKGSLSLDGGAYFSGGVQVLINKFLFECLFKSFGGIVSLESGEGSNTDIDIKYTTFSIGVGLQL